MRFAKSFFNFTTGLGKNILVIFISFFATPYLLKWLGNQDYALYRVSLDWFGYLALLELGLAGAMIPIFGKNLAEKRETETKLTLRVGLRYYAIIVLISIFFGIALSYIVPEVSKVDPGVVSRWQSSLLILVVGLFTILTNPFKIFADSQQKSYFVTSLSFVQFLILTGFGLFFAWKGFGLRGQLIAFVIGQFTFATPLLIWGIKHYLKLKAHTTHSESQQKITDVKKQIWRFNGPTFLTQLSGRVSLMSDNIILSLFVPIATITPFYLTQRLISMSQNQLLNIGNSVWAGLAEIYHHKDLQLFQKRVLETTKIICVGATSVLVPITCYNYSFITLWIGENQYAGPSVTVLACANAFFLSLSSFWTWCIHATGFIESLPRFTITFATLNVIFSFLLTWRVGITGPLLGTVISYVAVSSWGLPYLLKKHFQISPWSIYKQILPSAALSFIWSILLYFRMDYPLPQNWFLLLTEMAFSFFTILSISWWIILNKEQRRAWGERIIKVLKLIKKPS